VNTVAGGHAVGFVHSKTNKFFSSHLRKVNYYPVENDKSNNHTKINYNSVENERSKTIQKLIITL